MKIPFDLADIDPAEILPEIGRELMRTFDMKGRTMRRPFIGTAVAVTVLCIAAAKLGPQDGSSAVMEIAASMMGQTLAPGDLASLDQALDPANLSSLGWDDRGGVRMPEARPQPAAPKAAERTTLSSVEVLAAQAILVLPLFGLYTRRMRAIGWPISVNIVTIAVCATPYPWAALAIDALLALWPERDPDDDGF